MWEVIAALTIWAIPAAPPNIAQQPVHVSCLDGHIVENLSDCPVVARPGPNMSNVPYGGGAAPRGGGPRGLLGLGGIGGIL